MKISFLYDIIYVTQGYHMSAKQKSKQDKEASLRSSGALNPCPEKVQDPIFLNKDFFDPRDIVQVKYELLRRVQTEGVSVSDAVKSFGFSRLFYYRVLDIFEELGLCGLVPQKRGPKQAYKLNAEILGFMNEQIQKNPSIKTIELKTEIEKKFKFSIHARTIERALIKKKRTTS
jgi:transposase